MAESTLPHAPALSHQHASTKTNNSLDTPVLAALADLIAGKLNSEEAATLFLYHGAPLWLIRSVNEIERQFAHPEPNYCGPMAATVQKVLG